MKKTRIAAKWFVATAAATALVVGSMSAPAQAAKDTGWGPISSDNKIAKNAKDTGWGP